MKEMNTLMNNQNKEATPRLGTIASSPMFMCGRRGCDVVEVPDVEGLRTPQPVTCCHCQVAPATKWSPSGDAYCETCSLCGRCGGWAWRKREEVGDWLCECAWWPEFYKDPRAWQTWRERQQRDCPTQQPLVGCGGLDGSSEGKKGGG
jgi:hypothetical protein